MPAVFLGHVCPSGSLRSPCYSSWEGMGRREEDVILTSSWKQERVGVWEQCHLSLLLLGRCPLWPGLPANSHKQVCTPTIWSLPPKSEPKEGSFQITQPPVGCQWQSPWHLSAISLIQPSGSQLNIHNTRGETGSDRLTLRASSCQP